MLSKLSVSRVLNILHSIFEWKFRQSMVSSKPFIFRIEVSAICNLKCPSCPTTKRGLDGVPTKLMSLLDFQNIFDKLKNKAWRLSFYISGEPMTNPNLLDMVGYVTKANVYTHFSTNFTLLKSGMAKKMIESKLDSISVCLDGYSQKNYSKYRVGGNVETVKNGIIELCKTKNKMNSKKPFLNVYTITFNHSIADLPKIKEFCKVNHVDKLTIRPDQLNFDGSGVKKSKTKVRHKSKCFWPWMTMIIDTSGNVYPCQVAHRSHPYGNIKNNSLEEIWNNEKYVRTRNFLSGKEKKCNSFKLPCLNCKLYNCS